MTESSAGRDCDLTVVALPIERRPNPRSYDAVLLGSAVYVGRWLEPARHYAAEHASSLRSRPLWLFSSGPIGEPPFPPDLPHDVEPLAAMLRARGQQVFPGRPDKSRLTIGERAMVAAMRAPVGDFRDWATIRSWAQTVAADIAGSRSTSPASSS